MAPLMIILAGALGATARFAIDAAVSRRWRRPAGTVLINVVGSFALGVLVGAGTTGRGASVAGAGFLGAFTTFSTYALDAVSLGHAGQSRRAAAYAVGSVLAGAAAAGLGLYAGRA